MSKRELWIAKEEIWILGTLVLLFLTTGTLAITEVPKNSSSSQSVEQKANEANDLMISKMNESLEQELALHPGFLAQEKSWVLSGNNNTVVFGENKDFERVGENLYSAHVKNKFYVFDKYVGDDTSKKELGRKILSFEPVINIDHGSYSASAQE